MYLGILVNEWIGHSDVAHAEGAYKGSALSQCPGLSLWPVFSRPYMAGFG